MGKTTLTKPAGAGRHFLQLALFLVVAPGTQAALPTNCPDPAMIQTPLVQQDFSDEQFQGFYYELAMKDATQPRGICSCQTSNKTFVDFSTIVDDFAIQCAGAVYHNDLSFEVHPDRRGVNIGTWNGVPWIDMIQFPNTIVDMSVNPATGEYDWVIEFQCVQGPRIMGNDWIAFYAINFYSKDYRNASSQIALMEKRFRQQGLGDFIDDGLELAIIDHSDCLENH